MCILERSDLSETKNQCFQLNGKLFGRHIGLKNGHHLTAVLTISRKLKHHGNSILVDMPTFLVAGKMMD